MIESREYFDAFNYWFDLLEKGVKTSKAIELTAERFNKSPRMMWYAHNDFDWKTRAEEKQVRIRKELEKQSDKMYAESKQKLDLLLQVSNELCELKHLFLNNFKMEYTRDSNEYKEFKYKVLNRDKVCQCCGGTHDLEVHHLFSFKNYNHLGVDMNNAIVLCRKCHGKYHQEYGFNGVGNNPVSLLQFLKDNEYNCRLDEWYK